MTVLPERIKALRIKADYKNIAIDESKANISIDGAKLINKILTENFTI